MKRKVWVCPECGSTDVEIGFELDKSCNSCGYRSSLFLNVDSEDVEKFRKRIKSRKDILHKD